MFSKLREHSAIFVSGPQRSGTRICAKMIAHDTEHRFIDETEAKWLFLGRGIADRDTNWDDVAHIVVAHAQSLIDEETNFVFHCPTFMPWIHRINGAHVVVMRRSIADIVKSAIRIQWKKGRQELEYNKMGYTRFGRKKENLGLTKTSEPISKLKYEYWDSCQKSGIVGHQEVEYDSLSDHSLWVSPNNRSNFRWNQTQLPR